MVFNSNWERRIGLVMFYEEESQQYVLSSLKLSYNTASELPMSLNIEAYDNDFSYLFGLERTCDEFDFLISDETNENYEGHCMFCSICDHNFILTFNQVEILNDIFDIALNAM